MPLLALPCWDGEPFEPVVYHCFAILKGEKKVEPAGSSFELLVRRLRGEDEESKEAEKGVEDEYNEDEKLRADWEKKKKKQDHEVQEKLLGKKDYYEVLGIGHLAFSASQDDIKKAHRKMVLKYHPDKLNPQEVDPIFLQIQEAFEVLSDPAKRRAHDSSLPFDESIPADNDTGDFFEVYGPVFQRNARFSTRKPVPLLGFPETPFDKVMDFYDFWLNFQSWRDFSHLDEYNLDDADSREEKRWMERQNEKNRVKLKKKEQARLIRLAENAYRKDPRIVAQKEKEKQEKLRAKQEKEAAKQREKDLELQKEQERLRLEEEKKKKEEEEARVRKMNKEQEKKAIKQERHKLRTLLNNGGVSIADEDLESLFKFYSSAPELAAVCSSLEQAKESLADAVQAEILKCQAEEKAKETERLAEVERRRQEDEAKKKAAKEASITEWTPDELSLLAKGLTKFPGGMGRRWHQISQFIGTKTQEEVIAKAKEMAQGTSLTSMGSKISSKAFEIFQQQEGVMKKLEAEADKRELYGEVHINLSAASSSSSLSSSTTSGSVSPASSAPSGASTPAATPTATPTAATPTASEWNREQQEALEKALAKFPASMPANDRWTAIAKEVPGKTKKDCVARFKELREAIMANKK